MKFIRENITFILGISIPVAMILFISLSVYLPGLFIKPKFNFLYSIDNNSYYDGGHRYSISNGKIIKNEVDLSQRRNAYAPEGEPKLFIHNVAGNESIEVSFADALKLNLDSNAKSPDGFEIVSGGSGGGFFPFFYSAGTDYNAKYLKGKSVGKKLYLQTSPQQNYYSFYFLGWIKQ